MSYPDFTHHRLKGPEMGLVGHNLVGVDTLPPHFLGFFKEVNEQFEFGDKVRLQKVEGGKGYSLINHHSPYYKRYLTFREEGRQFVCFSVFSRRARAEMARLGEVLNTDDVPMERSKGLLKIALSTEREASWVSYLSERRDEILLALDKLPLEKRMVVICDPGLTTALGGKIDVHMGVSEEFLSQWGEDLNQNSGLSAAFNELWVSDTSPRYPSMESLLKLMVVYFRAAMNNKSLVCFCKDHAKHHYKV